MISCKHVINKSIPNFIISLICNSRLFLVLIAFEMLVSMKIFEKINIIEMNHTIKQRRKRKSTNKNNSKFFNQFSLTINLFVSLF